MMMDTSMHGAEAYGVAASQSQPHQPGGPHPHQPHNPHHPLHQHAHLAHHQRADVGISADAGGVDVNGLTHSDAAAMHGAAATGLGGHAHGHHGGRGFSVSHLLNLQDVGGFGDHGLGDAAGGLHVREGSPSGLMCGDGMYKPMNNENS